MYAQVGLSRARIAPIVAAAVFGLGIQSLALAAPDLDDEQDATTFPQVERKVKNLKKRVRQLEAEVAALQATHFPIEVSVDCAAGNTIGAALADHADGEGLLTIRVAGVCAEAVVIDRSNVTLQGQTGAAVQVSSPTNFAITVGANVDHVIVSDLTVTGSGTAGILVHQGAHALARNVVVHTAGSGVMALDNGVLNVAGSTLRNNAQGAYASRGGIVSLSSSFVENNTVGALAFKAGVVIFTSRAPDISASTGSIVRNNVNGAVARSGGFLEFADTVVENNTANGIVADSGGVVHLFANLGGGGNRISGNVNLGLVFSKNTSLVVQDLTNVITANGRGISCNPAASYLVPPGFTVTGNLNGDILGCTP